MSDVSCKVIRSVLEYLELRHVDRQEVLERIRAADPTDSNLSPSRLLEGRGHIPWNSFATVMDVIEDYLRDPEAQEGLFIFSAKTGTKWMPFRTVVRLLSNPRQFYLIYCQLIAPLVYGKNFKAEVESLDRTRLQLKLSIPRTLKPSPFFFAISTIGLVKMPMIIGLPDAHVEARTSGWEAEYIITPPRSVSLVARMARAVRVLFFPQAAFAEFNAQERLIRQEYERVQASEARYRALNEVLESRVRERTCELEQANQNLQARLIEITRKEEENQKLQATLVHLQKLEAIGTLSRGLSHEINNVLHGVFLSLDTTERRLGPGHSAIESLQIAKKFSKRGQDVMKQVLAFSRNAQLEKRAIRLIPTIQDGVKLMRSTLPKSIRIFEEYGDMGPNVGILADETQIQQVIINLCANAAYAMREAGGDLHIRVSIAGACVAIEVEDTGDGIPESIQHRIFEPFFTTKPVGQGSGMGLAVVHGLVQAFSGSIRLTSQFGKGTVFRIELPLTTVEKTASPSSAEIRAAGGEERILIVDDEPEILRLLEGALATFGYRVLTADNPESAVRLFSEECIDLVLTDLVMPQMNGIGLAKRLKVLKPQVPIILCTGHGDTELAWDEKNLFASVSYKPLDGHSLNDSIRSAFRPPG